MAVDIHSHAYKHTQQPILTACSTYNVWIFDPATLYKVYGLKTITFTVIVSKRNESVRLYSLNFEFSERISFNAFVYVNPQTL